MFREYIDGVHGFNGVAKALNREGVPTARGKTLWHRVTIRQLLANPVYMGTFYANRVKSEGVGLNRFKSKEDRIRVIKRPMEDWIPVLVPPIVDAQTFERVQQLATAASTRQKESAKTSYMLSSLVVCGRCGGSMHGVNGPWGNSGRKRRRYYYCRRAWAGSKATGCYRRAIADELEETVYDLVKEFFSDPYHASQVAAAQEDSSMVEQTKRSLTRELNRLAKSRAAFLNLLEHGAIEVDDALDRMNRMTQRENDIKKELDHLGSRDIYAYDEEWLESHRRALAGDLSWSEKKAAIRDVVEWVKVEGDGIGIRLRIPNPNRGNDPLNESRNNSRARTAGAAVPRPTQSRFRPARPAAPLSRSRQGPDGAGPRPPGAPAGRPGRRGPEGP
jgi:site-specific DNA recombinase